MNIDDQITKPETVTLSVFQLLEAVDCIAPDWATDPDQLEHDITFGCVQWRDDDGTEHPPTLCVWNSDTDGVIPLSLEAKLCYTQPQGDVSAVPSAHALAAALASAERRGWEQCAMAYQEVIRQQAAAIAELFERVKQNEMPVKSDDVECSHTHVAELETRIAIARPFQSRKN